MKEWKLHNMENDRKCIPQKMIEKSFPRRYFSIIFQGAHFLSFSMSYIFHSFIFQVCFFCHFPGVHFPLCHFPVVTFLSFSGVCIFYLFPCRTFSILSFSGCDFLSFSSKCIFYLFHVVHFPCRALSMSLIICHAFSMSCIFHSFVFQVCFFCHFPDVIFLPFSGCAISILAFSRVCIFHSG